LKDKTAVNVWAQVGSLFQPNGESEIEACFLSIALMEFLGDDRDVIGERLEPIVG